jgi:hypothetical protein
VGKLEKGVGAMKEEGQKTKSELQTEVEQYFETLDKEHLKAALVCMAQIEALESQWHELNGTAPAAQ